MCICDQSQRESPGFFLMPREELYYLTRGEEVAQKEGESEQQATPPAARRRSSEPRPQQGVQRLPAQGADGSFCPGVNGCLQTAVDLTSAHHRS